MGYAIRILCLKHFRQLYQVVELIVMMSQRIYHVFSIVVGAAAAMDSAALFYIYVLYTTYKEYSSKNFVYKSVCFDYVHFHTRTRTCTLTCTHTHMRAHMVFVIVCVARASLHTHILCECVS